MKFLKFIFSVAVFGLLVSCEEMQTPVADFNTNGVVMVNKPVSFINASGNGNVYSWDFGDKKKSEEVHPFHTYKKSGTYVVSLQVKNGEETAVKSKLVYVENAANPVKVPDVKTIVSDISVSQPVKNVLPLLKHDSTWIYVMQANAVELNKSYNDSAKIFYSKLVHKWWALRSIKHENKEVGIQYPDLFSVMYLADDGSYYFFENCTDTWKWGYWCTGVSAPDVLVLNTGSIYERLMMVDKIEQSEIRFSFYHDGKLLKLSYTDFNF